MVYSLNMFGDAVRDRLDPRLRGGGGRLGATAANGGEQHAAGKLKEFGLSCFAIGHPTSVVVLTLILIVTGFVSYFRVPRESMPEIVIPNIIVTTVSSINVEFEAGMDMTEALQGIREKVDLAKAELPSAANDPQIFEINTSRFPIMQVNVAGPYNQVRLREVAEGLQERIEQIPSVLEAQLSGGLEREVHVDVDVAKLKFYSAARRTLMSYSSWSSR